MKRAPFQLANETIKPGCRALIRLPLPGLHSETSVNMPVHVVHGKKDGPTVFISAAIHGDEINGVEAIRRLLSANVLNKLRGTLIVVPVVNVLGFDDHSRYLPDRRDLNRSFPGRPEGSLAGRVAHLFMTEIVSRADLGIDLHTAAIHRDNYPQIRADLNNKELNHLARVFSAPVLLHSAAPEGSLRHAAAEVSVPIMVYEAGEALRFDEIAVRVAVRGIFNVLRDMQMLPQSRRNKLRESFLLRSSNWMRASRSGILRASVSLGQTVKEGDILGYISDPSGQEEDSVEATSAGIIIGRTNIPLVYEGDALFHIGRTHQTKRLESQIDHLMDDQSLAVPELVEEPSIV